MVKLLDIKREDPNITFYFEDGETLEYVIESGSIGYYLDGIPDHNISQFEKLGIDPDTLYDELGIFKDSGLCPYCDLDGFDILIKYLKDNHCVASEEQSEDNPEGTSEELDEWDWIL